MLLHKLPSVRKPGNKKTRKKLRTALRAESEMADVIHLEH